MEEKKLHLTPEQIDRLIHSLHAFHGEYEDLAGLLNESREALLLKGFRRFLERFLEEGTDPGAAARRLARDYFEQNIPFVLLMASFNHLKEELIQLVTANLDAPLEHYRETDRIFEDAKREAARCYLVAEAKRPQILPTAIIQEKILIRIYLEWMDRIRQGIVEDLAVFPLVNAAESVFSQALRYPESMLICLDLKLCDQIQERHQLIHQQASILYTMLSANRHEQAYLAYQELVQQVSQLLNLLSVLYFESQTNRINRFFNFVQASLYLPGRKFLCVVNLRKLDKINKLYGNEVGDKALALIEKSLRDEFERNQEWMLFTRGIAGDFYVAGYHAQPDKLDALLSRIRQSTVHDETGELPLDIDLVYHGIEITRISELTTESMHLVVQYLTERARQNTEHIEACDEQIDTMLDWLRKRHHKSMDLRAKLTEDSTDIFIQPLVTLDDKRHIHAFEVLGRFRENDGYLSAGLFIDDIIEIGLIMEFDQLVLKAVVRHVDDLKKITSRLFINVSATSLEQPEYLDFLVTSLHGPLREFEVVLELTEQVLLEHRSLIHELHRTYGLSFAIDDFGTGYSTLQSVIELALEGSIRYLKIDGSLTRNLTTSLASERIMQITRQMAHELGLKTVVELIETTAQADKLELLRMDLGQGYLLGIP
ncbi:MAG TPA: EAL domain-containing protein, partial [Chromatiaceae bacterium]|nr:EAL domain-containing protein [Chromatiaceae bacterium]